jgi:serine O-acetyltransferase
MSVPERAREDVRAVLDRDPAATGVLEVLLCYPGLHAIWGYRLAHALWERDRTLSARLFSQLLRFLTGIEIHPAATIGRRFAIDHGMGVVIGATAEIGTDVHCYHGVTLGAHTGASGKRHPTVEDSAVLGAGSTVLGDVRVGEAARVGAGAVVVDSVQPGTTVVGIPARPIDEDPSASDPSNLENHTGRPSTSDGHEPTNRGRGEPMKDD